MAAGGAHAQDFFEQASDYFKVDSIEGVSKHAESPAEAPATVTIVDRDQIERYGFRTVAEVLDFASLGNFVHGDRRYDLTGSRGLFFFEDFNTRILVMINGHAINEPWASFADIGRAMLVPMDLVDRIEIVYGPSSLLYGGYSLYGIVNVVTRTASALPSLRVRATGGNWRTGEVVASFGATGVIESAEGEGVPKEWSLLVAAGYGTTDGEDLDLPVIDVGYAVALDGSTLWGGPQQGTDFERAPFAFLHARRGNLSFLGRAGYRKRGTPLAPYGAIYGSTGQTLRDAKTFLDARWDHSFSTELGLSLRAFHDSYGYRERDPYADSASYPPALGYDFELDTDSRETGAEARVTASRGTHHLTVGGEVRYRSLDLESRSRFFDGTVAPGSAIPQRNTGRFAVIYAQEEWRPLQKLSLIAGGSFANTSPGGSKIQPRLAAIFKPQPAVSIKGLYGRGFRPPTLFEGSYQDFVTRIGNPSIKSESIESYELSLMWSPTERVALQAYGFVSRLEGLIQSIRLSDVGQIEGGVVGPGGNPADLVGMQQYQSAGDVKSHGVGASARLRQGGFQGHLNIAWASARSQPRGADPEQDLPGSPTWLGNAGASYERGPWTGGLVARYVGSQDLHPLQGAGTAGNFAEANLHLKYRTRLVYPVTIHAHVMNLFDTGGSLSASTIYSVPRVPIPGRRFTIGAEVQF